MSRFHQRETIQMIEKEKFEEFPLILDFISEIRGWPLKIVELTKGIKNPIFLKRVTQSGKVTLIKRIKGKKFWLKSFLKKGI